MDTEEMYDGIYYIDCSDAGVCQSGADRGNGPVF